MATVTGFTLESYCRGLVEQDNQATCTKVKLGLFFNYFGSRSTLLRD